MEVNGTNRGLTVLYFGSYRAGYSRNRIMIEGLRKNGVEVIECHEKLWSGIEDRVTALVSQWKDPRFWLRVIRVYFRLIKKFMNAPNFDITIVGYPGQLDVYLARILTWLRRKPLVWDIFMSIYLIAMERGLGKRSPVGLKLLRIVERWACRLPDQLIIDTEDYAEWFQITHGIPASRFALVSTGADTGIFTADEIREAHNPSEFVVLYYGTFIPNHGVEYVIRAADLLSDVDEIQFMFIGEGPEKRATQEYAIERNLQNVRFIQWLEPSRLAQEVREASVCLGAFGTTHQSVMTVQNKIYEGLAMGKVILTGDSRAIRRNLNHGEHIYLCERANPDSLAQAILELKENPRLRKKISMKGLALFQDYFTPEKIGAQFVRSIEHLL